VVDNGQGRIRRASAQIPKEKTAQRAVFFANDTVVRTKIFFKKSEKSAKK
jgi:hypothetical protein